MKTTFTALRCKNFAHNQQHYWLKIITKFECGIQQLAVSHFPNTNIE